MWIGQFGCEAFNWILKHTIKQERPSGKHTPPHHGRCSDEQLPRCTSRRIRLSILTFAVYGLFCIVHAATPLLSPQVYFDWECTRGPLVDASNERSRPRVGTSRVLFQVRPILIKKTSAYIVRFHLGYHTVDQILWGFGIGLVVGSVYYGITEYIPFFEPQSLPGKIRRWSLNSPVFTWLRIKDGWAVWQDGGHEEEYKRWRKQWDSKRSKAQ